MDSPFYHSDVRKGDLKCDRSFYHDSVIGSA